MLVKMMVHTGRPGKKISPGDIIEVDRVTGESWIKDKLARAVKQANKPKKRKKGK